MVTRNGKVCRSICIGIQKLPLSLQNLTKQAVPWQMAANAQDKG
jgi:hypothetical protein